MSKFSPEQNADALELVSKILFSIVENRKIPEVQSLKELLVALKTARKDSKRSNAWIPKEK